MKFPKAYVISPNRMRQRREECDKHLRSFGIIPVYLNGLDGTLMKLVSGFGHEQYGPYRICPFGPFGSSGICLAINHWCLWQHISISGVEAAVVFEDDVALPDDFMARFEETMDGLPSNWDWVCLGLLFPERIEDGRIGASQHRGDLWKFLGPNQWDGACDGTHAYMLSRSGAAKMASIPFSLREQIDRQVTFDHFAHGMNVFIWRHSGVKQRSAIPGAKGIWVTTNS